jgi:hypothetical protein
MTNANGKLLPFTPNSGDNSNRAPGDSRILTFSLWKPAPTGAAAPSGLRWVLFSRTRRSAAANESQEWDLAAKQRALQLRSMTLFEATTRQSPPHPLWCIACGAGGVLERILNGMQIALLAFYAALGLTAFPLLASGQYAGGIAMALVGGTFGSLLLARLRPKRLEDNSEHRPEQPPKVRGIDYLRWKEYGEWRRKVMRAEWMRRARETSPSDSA